MIRVGKARHARHGKAGGGHGPLTLIPMIDMLMILVVYLLVHSADTEILPNTKNISIPHSVSERKPVPSTAVASTRARPSVNGAAVVSVAEVAGSDAPVVDALQAALAAQAPPRLGDAAAPREVTVMAEKSLPYAVLRKIVASCSAADYSKVSLAVVEREQALSMSVGA
jgi:biopolymer transport protein ExbD